VHQYHSVPINDIITHD